MEGASPSSTTLPARCELRIERFAAVWTPPWMFTSACGAPPIVSHEFERPGNLGLINDPNRGKGIGRCRDLTARTLKSASPRTSAAIP